MKRRRKRNPAGSDVVGFLVGASLAAAGGLFLGGGLAGVILVGGGVSVLTGIVSGIAGAEKPGVFRGAAVGSAIASLGSGAAVLAMVATAKPPPSPPLVGP